MSTGAVARPVAERGRLVQPARGGGLQRGSDSTSGIDSLLLAELRGTRQRERRRCRAPARTGRATRADRSPSTLKYDETEPEVTAAQAERQPAPGRVVPRSRPLRLHGCRRDGRYRLVRRRSRTPGRTARRRGATGECRDRAGNAAQRAFPLKFDGNPPGVSDLKLIAGDRRLDLSWATTADVASVEVARTPGVGTAAPSVVFGGPGTSFRDERVENGVRYTYKVTVRDIAGQPREHEVTGAPVAPPPTPVATPTSPTPPASGQPPRSRRLLAPLPGATIDIGPPADVQVGRREAGALLQLPALPQRAQAADRVDGAARNSS